MFISLNMPYCRNKWKKSPSSTWLWVWDQKQVLVINSPFVWTKEPLNSRGSGNAETKAEFSASFSLNTRKVMRTYSTESLRVLERAQSWLRVQLSAAGQPRNGLCFLAGLWTSAQGRQTHHGINPEKAPGPFSG